MTLHLLRDIVTQRETIGKIFIDGVWMWYSCEDVIREGPKIPGETAIPAGRYKVILSHSKRFNRTLPELLNVPGFTGIRMHPGNSFQDTRGCILVGGGYQPRDHTILHSRMAVDRIMASIHGGIEKDGECWIEIIDPPKDGPGKVLLT